MWYRIVDYFETVKTKTLSWLQRDLDINELPPTRKRHLERGEMEAEQTMKFRRVDSGTWELSDVIENGNRKANILSDESGFSKSRKTDLKLPLMRKVDFLTTPIVKEHVENSGITSILKKPSLSKKKSPGVLKEVRMPEVHALPAMVHYPGRENASTKNKLMVNESARLDEKRQYSELLQKYTSIPVETRQPAVMNAKNDLKLPYPFRKATRKTGGKIEIVDLTIDNDDNDTENDEPDIVKTEMQSAADELRQKIRNCKAYDAKWTKDLVAEYKKEHQNLRKLLNAQWTSILKKKSWEDYYHQVLEERMRQHMRISEVAVEEGPIPIAEEEEKLPELTTEMDKRINYALRPGPQSEVLSEAFNQRITRRDIQTLGGTHWLNDEIINFYMNLLIERGKNDKYPAVYCFNTFFYTKLASSGHASLKRWTRKVDIFAHEILIIPVHLGVHWCVACVKFPEKKIEYYDSMGGRHARCLHDIMRYLHEESLDKKRKPFDATGWTTVHVSDNPQQMNGSDCGMFSCMYAEYLCRKAKITFTQKDMPYFRRKMVYEILTKKLLL